jgi:PAS domain S-box-containing protein
MAGSYDYGLVFWSVLIAIVASYAAFDLAARVSAARGPARLWWLVGGAAATGIGTWSMHFLGMLAFRLPVPIHYHWPTVLISLGPAILSYVAALWVVSGPHMSSLRTLVGGALMGSGIGGLHYIAMESMRMSAMCHYSPVLVVLSVLVATAGSMLALRLVFVFKSPNTGSTSRKIAAATLMGVAIAGMHYTAMAASTFMPVEAVPDLSQAVNITDLGVAGLVVLSITILGSAVITSAIATEGQRVADRILEATPDILYIYDLTTSRTVNINAKMLSVLGYPLELDRDSRTLIELIHLDDRQRMVEHLRSCESLSDGEVAEIEFRALHADGEWRWLARRDAPFAVDHTGKVTQILGMVRDITAHRTIEQTMHEQKARLQLALNGTNDGIWDWNAITGEVYHSPRWKNMLGYGDDDLLDEPGIWENLVHPEDLERVKSELQVHLEQRTPQYVSEYRIRANDGDYRWILARGQAVWDDQGRPLRMVGAHADVTDRKLVEELLREAERAAHEANAAKTDFLARMSHEMRTPMNVICGLSELLWDTELTTDQREYVRIFRSNSEVLLNLINDVLDVTKVEAGGLQLQSEPFDLNEVLETTRDLLAPVAEEKGLDLHCVLDPEAVTTLLGDRDRLQQILVNLVGNAIKFTQEGEVRVRASRDPDKSTPGALLFEVSDTGPGIDPVQAPTIFEPFVQADSSTTRKHHGTGLGLTLARKLVELMGGQLWLESQLGEGSVFYFTVSLGVAASVPARLRTDAPLPPARVLVVDDDPITRMLLVRQIQALGLQLVEGASGREALDRLAGAALSNRHYSVVILDRTLPDLDQFNIAAEIRDNLALGEPAVVLLTFHSEERDITEIRELGIHSMLTKPIKATRLEQALRKALIAKEPPHTKNIARELPASQPESRSRILVADDSETNRFLIAAYLQHEPYDLDFAEDGAVAVRKALTHPYDLILMDVQMPELDGYEATRHIRAFDKSRGRKPVPIIAITAHALATEAGRAREAGCTSYLSKPMTKAAVIREIELGLASAGTPETSPALAKPLPKEIQDLVPDYVAQLGEDADGIQVELNDGGFEAISRIAHNLKGSGTSFGLPQVSELGAKLEVSARALDRWGTQRNLDALRQVIAEARGALPS